VNLSHFLFYEARKNEGNKAVADARYPSLGRGGSQTLGP